MRKILILALLACGSIWAGTTDFNTYGAMVCAGSGAACNGQPSPISFDDFTLTGSDLQVNQPNYFGSTTYEVLDDGGLLGITFTTTQNSFTFNLREYEGFGSPSTVTVFGADNTTVLNTFSVSFSDDGFLFAFSDSEALPIGSVTIGAGSDGWSGILQSVTVDSVADTPEPSTLLLFGSAFAGILATRRRSNA